MKLKETMRKMMSHKEYEANLAGMNIVFGAMVGVVMGSVREMSALNYSLLLLMVAAFVINILYISASKQRFLYALMAGVVIAICWFNAKGIEELFGIDSNLMEQRLLPIAAVWLFMTVFIEFIPRGRPDPDDDS